jgi:hypothetical protein
MSFLERSDYLNFCCINDQNGNIEKIIMPFKRLNELPQYDIIMKNNKLSWNNQQIPKEIKTMGVILDPESLVWLE